MFCSDNFSNCNKKNKVLSKHKLKIMRIENEKREYITTIFKAHKDYKFGSNYTNK